MKDLGNPFQEESKDLLTLDTQNIAHPSAAELLVQMMSRMYFLRKVCYPAFSLHFEHCCLAPYAGSLEGRPFYMLNEGCTCRWNGIITPLLPSKQVQSCLINLACSAVLVIHGDAEFLKDIEVCIFYDRWVLTELFEDRAHFRPNLPCLPYQFSCLYHGKLTHHHSQ